jgi:hypothetical protein
MPPNIIPHLAFLFLTLWVPHSSRAGAGSQTSEFDIDGQIILIPDPENFVKVTPENMPLLYRFAQQLSDPMNDTLAYYVPLGTVDGQDQEGINKSFVLKISKSLRNTRFSRNEFERFKSEIATNNRKIFQEVQEKVGPHMQATSDNLAQEFDMDISMKVDNIRPMPPHLDTETSFGFSTQMNLDINLEGEQESEPMVVTSVFTDPAGVLLFLYCYSEPQDLQWARDASNNWCKAILSVNPPAPESSLVSKINWSQVAKKGLVGAMLGGILGLLISFASKRRRGQ